MSIDTGVKISQHPLGATNTGSLKNKLVNTHYFISYAPVAYGAKQINRNFRVSLDDLRKDIKGYIGLENVKGDYRNYIQFWSGYWSHSDRTLSYVFDGWTDSLKHHEDYIFDKFGKLNDEKSEDRIFLLKSAPLPLEAQDTTVNPTNSNTYGADPAASSNKFVNKTYVDDRHNGFRKVNSSSNTNNLSIRPYTCYYQYSNLLKPLSIAGDKQAIYTINICDDVVLEDGTTFKEKIKHNRLVFYVRITNRKEYHFSDTTFTTHFNNLRFLVNGQDKVKWSYENELQEILRECRIKEDESGNQLNVCKDYIFVRFEAEYINNVFTVSGTNFFGRGKHAKRIVEMTPNTTTGEVKTIDLGLYQNESFVTQIPPQNANNSIKQTVIKFDVSGLNDFHEYTWNYYVITPDYSETTNYDNVIFENYGDSTNIMWAMTESFNSAPELEPNRLYCFEFVKALDDVLIGRIKYFVNLVKKN